MYGSVDPNSGVCNDVHYINEQEPPHMPTRRGAVIQRSPSIKLFTPLGRTSYPRPEQDVSQEETT
jgi:hypothetical protein